MNTQLKVRTLTVADDRAIDRARQSRRIAAAFVWSRVSITPPPDAVIAEPAPANPSRHELGAAPTMVNIRKLVSVRDDITSTGRHAALDPRVLAALEAAGAR